MKPLPRSTKTSALLPYVADSDGARNCSTRIDAGMGQQTETLKLLFVLYFRILKNPHPTPLLPAALRGIARFSHLVNVDFFKDLMQVLKELMTREGSSSPGDEPAIGHMQGEQHYLLCIVTAFELLSGQGSRVFARPKCMTH